MAKATQQTDEIAQLKAAYAAERAQLKASGEATQQGYQQLKKAHEAALAEAGKVPDLAKQLKASQEQATTAKAQADKLAADLKTAQQQGMAKATQQTDESVAPPAQPERRPTPAAPAQTPAPAATAQQPAVRPALAPRPTPAPAPAVQAPAPAPVPTLAERLAESLQRLLDWIKGQGGVLKEIDTEKADCYGAVVQLDDLHAVQRVGRGTYAIHQLDKLDKVPALDYPKTEISYQGGRGTVVGPGYGHGLGR